MSTSCVVTFVEDGEPLCAFYKHCDGHTFDKRLGEFLTGFEVVNGLPGRIGQLQKIANGVGDLAAQTISYFKEGPGDIYITSLESEGDYNYVVSTTDAGRVQLKMKEYF